MVAVQYMGIVGPFMIRPAHGTGIKCVPKHQHQGSVGPAALLATRWVHNMFPFLPTAAILIARSSPPWFIVDRPFLFFIRHNPTGK